MLSDEQQILYTSVSMAELGEIGIAQGQMFMFHRKGGDAVSPFGMGLSLADTIPSFLAGSFERSHGATGPCALVAIGLFVAQAPKERPNLRAVRTSIGKLALLPLVTLGLLAFLPAMPPTWKATCPTITYTPVFGSASIATSGIDRAE